MSISLTSTHLKSVPIRLQYDLDRRARGHDNVRLFALKSIAKSYTFHR
jgi:hypothetical protein